MNNLHFIDIAIVIGYLILCITIGVLNMRGVKTIRDYAIGTGYISTSMLAATLYATHIGAGSIVGEIEQLHSLGMIFAITIISGPLIWLTTAKVFAGHIEYFKKAGCISLSDIMELLYGKPGRWITNVAAQLMAIFVIAVQIVAIGYLFNYFLGISQGLGALIGFGVLVTYSMLGGIKAVVATDAFQGFIFFVGVPAACFAGYQDVGGYDGLMQSLPQTHLKMDFTIDNTLLLLSLIFWIIVPFSHGAFVQRFLMANSSQQLKTVFKSLFLIAIPFSLIVCLVGLIVKAKAPDINSNVAFFYLIGNYLPVGVKGFVIIGILAAIMSTADSWLNTVSVLCAHDIIKKLFPNISDKQELMFARLSLICVAGLSSFIAFYKSGSILGIQWLAASFWDPLILVPLCAGFLKFQTNGKSFIGAAICGIIFTFIGAYLAALDTSDNFKFATISMAIGIIGSAMGLFGTHYLQKLNNYPINLRSDPRYK